MDFSAGRLDLDLALSRVSPLVTLTASASLAGTAYSDPGYELSGTLLGGSKKFFGGVQFIYTSEVLSSEWGGGQALGGAPLGASFSHGWIRFHPEFGVFLMLDSWEEGTSWLIHLGCGIAAHPVVHFP